MNQFFFCVIFSVSLIFKKQFHFFLELIIVNLKQGGTMGRCFAIFMFLCLVSTANIYAADGDMLVGGKLGVGTENPSNDLHVYTSSEGAEMKLESAMTSGYSRIWYQTDASYMWNVGARNDSGLGGGFSFENNYSGWQTKFFIDEDGNVGVGMTDPQSRLDVDGNIQISNSSIPMGLMTEVGGTTPLLNLSVNFREPDKNTNYQGAAFRIDTRSEGPLFQWLKRDAGSATDVISMVLTNDGNLGIGTTSPAGKLDVNGAIYQRGGVLHADYVFEPEYKLESIKDHAEFMWKNKHLGAIPKARIDENGEEIVELGARNRGVVEELEKAHIYIAELYDEIQNLKQKIADLETK